MWIIIFDERKLCPYIKEQSWNPRYSILRIWNKFHSILIKIDYDSTNYYSNHIHIFYVRRLEEGCVMEGWWEKKKEKKKGEKVGSNT